MIIGIGHKAQTGKDTIARYLVDAHGFKRIALADPLKELALQINPMIRMDGERLDFLVRSVGWEEAKKDYEVRRILQEVGQGARQHIASDVWVKALMHAAGEHERVVVPDVRLPDEFEAIRNAGGALWKVERRHRGVVQNPNHITETALDDAEWDSVLSNNSTVQSLELQVDSLVQELGWGSESTE